MKALRVALSSGELGEQQAQAIAQAVPPGHTVSRWLRTKALEAAGRPDLDAHVPMGERARRGGVAKAKRRTAAAIVADIRANVEAWKTPEGAEKFRARQRELWAEAEAHPATYNAVLAELRK